MKRIYIIIFSVFLISFAAKAQFNANFQIGADNEEYSGSFIQTIIGTDGDYLYAIKENPMKDIVYTKYDKNFKKVSFKGLDLVSDNKGRTFEYALISNGKIFVFSSFRIVDKDNKILYVQTIDKETLLTNRDLREVANVESRYIGTGRFEFRRSPDKKKLLVYCNYPYTKDQPEKFGLFVLDQDMNKIWSKVVSFSKDKVDGAFDLFLTNEGEVLMSGARFDDQAKSFLNTNKGASGEAFNSLQKEAISKNWKYDFWIRKYNDKSDNPADYNIALSNGTIRNLKALVDLKGNIVATGIYSAKENPNAKGAYLIKINPETNQVVLKSEKDFSASQLKQGMNPKELGLLEKSLANAKGQNPFQIDISHVTLKSDSGIVLVGAQYFNTMDWPDQMGDPEKVRKVKSSTYYQDINLISFTKTGDLQWLARVPKKYETLNDPEDFYGGYAYASSGNNFYVLVNNNPSNLKKTPESNMLAIDAKGGETVAMLFRITNDGKVDSQQMFSSRDALIRLCPKMCFQKDSKNFIFHGQKFTHQKFGLLKME